MTLPEPSATLVVVVEKEVASGNADLPKSAQAVLEKIATKSATSVGGRDSKVMDRAGMRLADMDVIELNEAFASQVLACVDELGIDMEKLNPHGGAIALGHPFGATGARIMTTLINDLQTLDGTYGLETMCVGGGQGMAMIVERLS